MKNTYYFTNNEGQEIKARTSQHEYNWFCLGKCSKSYDGALAEKTRRVNEKNRDIAYYKRCLQSEYEFNRYARLYKKGCSKEEVVADIEDSIELLTKDVETLKVAPVYKLYTK